MAQVERTLPSYDFSLTDNGSAGSSTVTGLTGNSSYMLKLVSSKLKYPSFSTVKYIVPDELEPFVISVSFMVTDARYLSPASVDVQYPKSLVLTVFLPVYTVSFYSLTIRIFTRHGELILSFNIFCKENSKVNFPSSCWIDLSPI